MTYWAATQCLLCEIDRATFVLTVEMQDGDRFAMAGSTPVCNACRDLLADGDVDGLAERLSANFEWPDRTEVATHLRDRVVAAVALPAESEEVGGLRRQGFVPLHDHTGAGHELAIQWPQEHVRHIDVGDRDDGWMVRSPWPRIDISEIFGFLWKWVERAPYDDALRGPRMAEVLAWDEARALAWQETCRPEE